MPPCYSQSLFLLASQGTSKFPLDGLDGWIPLTNVSQVLLACSELALSPSSLSLFFLSGLLVLWACLPFLTSTTPFSNKKIQVLQGPSQLPSCCVLLSKTKREYSSHP
ncbi:hypothetical protein MVEG_00865 [Podila verticillata NRRL 6337]|nr:hypothetical protein MVEG_00865 [Podila verticillata NRRL 6337]